MTKKIFLLIIGFLICTTIPVSAKKCIVVSGTGNNLGDEIKCGTENFYILKKYNNSYDVFSKYNLYIGENVDQIDYPENYTGDIDTYLLNNYTKPFDYYNIIEINGVQYIRLFTYINEDDPKFGIQNSLALGAHGGSYGKPDFPQYGLSRVFGQYNFLDDEDIKNNVYNDYYVNATNVNFSDDFNFYLDYLNNNGFAANELNILKVSDIKKYFNVDLPLKEWGDNLNIINKGFNDSLIYGNLNDYIDNKYNWLWSTTYWTSTSQSNSFNNMFFIDTLGNLCNEDYCTSLISAGVRPIINFNSDILYRINVIDDGNGSVDYKIINGKIQLKYIPNINYEIDTIKAYDSNNNVLKIENDMIDLLEDDITINVSFRKKSIIEKLTNPETGSSYINLVFITCFVVLLSYFIVLVLYSKHSKKINS